METHGFTEIRYDKPRERVARLTLARPETRNAQSRKMLYEINRALDIAMHDNEVRVVVLAADGPHFRQPPAAGGRADVMEGGTRGPRNVFSIA